MVKLTHLDDAFSEFLLEVSPAEDQSLQQKDGKGKIGKVKKKKQKPKDIGHFLIQKL